MSAYTEDEVETTWRVEEPEEGREGDASVAVVGQVEIAASGADLLYGADPVSGQGDLQGSARLGDLALELLTL